MEKINYNNLKKLSIEERIDCLRSIDQERLKSIFKNITAGSLAELIKEFPSDEIVDILELFSTKKQNQIIEKIEKDKAKKISQLLYYGKNTAGGIMAAEYLTFNKNMSIEEVISKIRETTHDVNRVFYIYVVDDKNILEGTISIRDLIVRQPSIIIKDIVNKEVITLQHSMDKEEAANIFQKHSYLALPVIDEKRHLVGVITADDISRVVRDEATEDILKISGISSDELSIDTPIGFSIKKRLPWLALNMLLDVIAVSVIAMYQGTLQAVIAIAVLMPMISDMGGNTGFQSLSLVIRDFALNKITTKDFWKIFKRQSIIGLIIGIVLGLEFALLAYLWKWNPYLGLIAGSAMLLNVYVAGLIGALFPLFLKSIKIDPAVATGPILTTITDLTGFLIILTLASKSIDLIK